MSIRRIDFVILGAQKCGTTSLVDYLRQHPDVYFPTLKEVPFFFDPASFELGDRFLEPFYAEARDEARVGLVHVGTLSEGTCARRIQSYDAGMKLVAVLRNPIDRAYSSYWHARRAQERLPTFEEALEAEPERLAGSDWERRNFGYIRAGEYLDLLEPYLDVFSRSQLKVILSEDLRDRTRATVEDLMAWLGLDPRDGAIDYSVRSNVASSPRLKWLQRLLMSRTSPLKRAYYVLVPRRLRHEIRRLVTKPLMRTNLRRFEYPPMARDTRQRLRAHYAGHNERLGRFLGRDLSHWK